MRRTAKKLKVLMATLLLTASISYGQDDQTVQAKNILDESAYMEYSIKHDEKSKDLSVIGVTAVVWTMTGKDYHESFKEIDLDRNPDDKMPGAWYFPDEEAFPATYVKGAWLGGPEEIEKYDVVETDPTKRMVIVGDWVYQLEDWKSKDDYHIIRLFKKGQVSKMAGLKESLKYKKNDPGDEFKKRLQDYLDAAFAKQAELLPAWNEANKELIAKRMENFKACWASLNDENDAYWASPKGQAKLARMRGEGPHSDKYYTIVNTGSSPLKLYSAGGPLTIPAGGSEKRNCIHDIYGMVQEGNHSKQGSLIHDGDDICGQTINMQ
jgi:hypothetical protein